MNRHALDRRVLLQSASLLALASCARRTAPAETVFAGMVKQFGEELITGDPERAAFLRLLPDGANLTKLRERGPLAGELARSQALRGLTELLGLEAQALARKDLPLFEVLLAHFSRLEPALQLGLGRFSQSEGPAPFVFHPDCAAIHGLPAVLANTAPIHDLGDAEDYVLLLGQCASVLDAEAEDAAMQAKQGWVAPPAILERLANACAQLLGQAPDAGPFLAPLLGQLRALGLLAASSPPPPGAQPIPAVTLAPAPPNPAQERAQALLIQADALVQRAIYPAIARTARLCEAQRALPQRLPANFSRDWLQAGLRFQTNDAIDIQKAYRSAQAQAKTLTDQLDMSLRALGVIDGNVGQRLSQLVADPRFDLSALSPEALITQLQSHFNAANAQSTNWFETKALSALRMEILAQPAGLGEDGARYRPAGSRAEDRAVLYLDLASLRSQPSFALANLVFSHGVPGRHVLSVLAKGANLPIALQMIGFPAFERGWRAYGAQLADEYGLFEADPWQRIGFLRAQLRGCAFLMCDFDLATKGMTRDSAIVFLQSQAGLAWPDAALAVDRMMACPGVGAGGEIGRNRIVAARDRARIGLGPGFDIRSFHALILAGGELPLRVMDNRVDAWIGSKQKSR